MAECWGGVDKTVNSDEDGKRNCEIYEMENGHDANWHGMDFSVAGGWIQDSPRSV